MTTAARPLRRPGRPRDRRGPRPWPRLRGAARGPGRRVAIHGMRQDGPADTARAPPSPRSRDEVAAEHGTAPTASLATSPAEPTSAGSPRRRGPLGPLASSSTMPAATSRPRAASPIRTTRSSSDVDVRAVLDRNLLSTILACQAVARGMMERRQGPHRHLQLGRRLRGRENGSIYAMPKPRSPTTRAASRISSVPSMSPLTASRPATPGRAASCTRAWIRADRRGRHPGALAPVDEVARVVEIFAGPLGDFVSGEVLRFDGGGQAWPA